MKFTFENKMVETAPFIDAYVILFFKMLIISIAFFMIVIMLLSLIKCKNKRTPSFVLLTFDIYITVIAWSFKTALTVSLVFLIFFYNFNIEQFVFQIPKEMPISLLFTGLLALYEVVAAVINMLQFGFSIYSRIKE